MEQNLPEEKKQDNKAVLSKKNKLLVIAAAIVVVVLIAVGVDYMVRHPKCNNEVDALNVVISDVLMAVDELGMEDPFSMEVMDNEVISGKNYYVVCVYNRVTGEEVEVGRYYIAESNSAVYTKNAEGQLVRFGK